MALLSACSDDDSDANPTDTDLPTVTVTGIQANATIWSTVNLTVAADDNEGVEKVELKVDNASVLTETEASFTYALNTVALELEDGQHTLTVIVTDAAGNEKKQDYTFTVLNTLISIDVREDFLEEGQRGFVFLSDASGKTIVSYEFENGEAVRLRAPAYTGSDFYLTEVVVDGGDDQELRTFSKVNRGTWTLTPDSVPYDYAPAGLATLSFTNILPGVDYAIHTDMDGATANTDRPTVTIDLYKSPSKVYITRNEDDNVATHYLLTQPVSTGSGNDPIDLGQVNTMLTKKTIDVSDYGYEFGGVSIVGLVTPGDFNNTYEVSYTGPENNELEYRYPGTAFPTYYSEVELFGPDFDVMSFTEGLPDLTPLAADADITLTLPAITGTVTGADIDFIMFDIEADDNTYWSLFTAKGAVNLVIPEIPENLQTLVTTESSDPYIGLYAIQKFNFDGYDGLLNFIRNSNHGTQELDGPGATYRQIEFPLTDDPQGRRQHAEKANMLAHSGRKSLH
jgi:archaellin